MEELHIQTVSDTEQHPHFHIWAPVPLQYGASIFVTEVQPNNPLVNDAHFLHACWQYSGSYPLSTRSHLAHLYLLQYLKRHSQKNTGGQSFDQSPLQVYFKQVF